MKPLAGAMVAMWFLSAGAAAALTPVEFSTLSGWQEDNQSAALLAFQASCEKPFKPAKNLAFTVAAMQRNCAVASGIPKGDTAQARKFFETHFQLFRAGGSDETGLVTGYYEPLVKGSRNKSAVYHVPAYAPPADMVAGEPYLTRKAINDGALAGKGLEVVWFSDPAELFFLQVQGSGRVELAEGGTMILSFAAKNHQPYTAIGKTLLERGELSKDDVSLYSIKAWLKAHPDKAYEVMNQNASYIFFKTGDGIRGAQGVVLTAERSLAVDPSYIPYGLPVFLSTRLTDGTAFQQLLVAQDTGTAIRGPLRGDIFFGFGKQAEARAAHLKSQGEYYLLLPREK